MPPVQSLRWTYRIPGREPERVEFMNVHTEREARAYVERHYPLPEGTEFYPTPEIEMPPLADVVRRNLEAWGY